MRGPSGILVLLFLPSLLSGQSTDLDNLYQANRWFEFRDAMSRSAPSAFYRGELALAFHDWTQAEKELSTAMKSGGDPAQAFEAGLGLQRIYALSGRRKEGRALLARMEQLIHNHEFSETIRTVFDHYRGELQALGSYPDQSVASRGASQLYYAQTGNHLIVPLQVNGLPGNYMLDTGSEECTISASEARRLGLVVHPAAIPLDTFSQQAAKSAGVAVAADLVIGNFHFRNVLFLVTDDEEPAGIIGMPVLLALQTLRWGSDGTLEFGFPGQGLILRDSNLCLAGASLLAHADLGKGSLNFVVDTGSYATSLFPRFARDFAEWMKDPVNVGPRYAGNDVTDPQVTTIAELPLRIGQRVLLSPAFVLSRDWIESLAEFHGLLGMDVLGRARSVTIDFSAMKLALSGAEHSPAACGLPPDFLCAPGWSCIVRRDENDGACLVDRLPVTPFAGNPIVSESDGENRCVLSSGANCSSGKLCHIVFDSNQSCHIEEVRAAPTADSTGGTRAPAPPASPVPAIAPPKNSPDVRDILQRWLKYDSLDDAGQKDYVYLQDEETKVLNKDGSVKETKSETREVMNLYDATYSRLIRKDGKELPPDKARAEQARFDKDVDRRAHETPETKAKRQEAERKAAAEALTCAREFLDVYDARITGSENVNGRPSWIVELQPRPNAAPHCGYLKIFSKFKVRLWIDQEEYRDSRVEADNIAPVTWGAFLVRVPAEGLHVETEQRRNDDGIWLAAQEHVQFNVKALLLVGARGDILTRYSGYRKFQADSRIVSVDGH